MRKTVSEVREVLKCSKSTLALKVAKNSLPATQLTRIEERTKVTKEKNKPCNPWMRQFFKNRI
jgi:hypothetical protein